MRRQSPEDTIAKKRNALIERTAQVLGIGKAEAAMLLATPRKQSIRINTLVASPEQTLPALKNLGWKGEPYAWASEGYTLENGLEAIRDSELVQNGQVFIQNAASWLPVLALNPEPHETILDMCAAPGGKTSHIAARTNNQALIWANDNSRVRLAKLQATMGRLHAHAEKYSLYDATALSRKLEGSTFDKVLLDAPCSGEGMMHIAKDKDLTTWSVAHIKRLQQLQKRLIVQAFELLRPGGTLVYSTCTMAPEENEAVIDYVLRRYEDAQVTPFGVHLPNAAPPVLSWHEKNYNEQIVDCLRLVPSANIEAFFVCKLRKASANH